ncbi:MAG: GNAT family N-acetyltransferase [Chloroflexi bacterium]|nr:GNAT family N-acetyltransferase [Chloroflexota bacterium]
MPLEIVALQEKHLEDATTLACARYKELRERVPLLPTRYEETDVIHSLLRDMIGQTPGAAAIQSGQLVGFLVGFVIPDFRGKRTAFSPEWANAANLQASRRIYQEMYTHLSARWVSDGCFTHLVSTLAHDRDAIDGWHWLGFGLMATDGVRDLYPTKSHAANIEIRRAGLQELDKAIRMDKALERHLASAPTFLFPDGASSKDKREQQQKEWVTNPANALLLAYQGTDVIGCIGLGPANPDACTIIQDEGTTSIMRAFTQEKARGRGIAAALLNRSLEWARAEGYERCAVDFEPMNFLAARFWMRHFQPVCYALGRQVDDRVGQTRERCE